LFAEIGNRLKKLRTDKGLTLKELGELTGLSVSFLSQLERGITTVAIDSLKNISDVLGVDIGHFFTPSRASQGRVVVKSYEKEILLMEGDNFVQFQLSHELEDKKMLPRLVEVFPRKSGETVQPYGHEGEEFIYILEGILTYYYNGEKHELYPNDSVHIHSSVPHIWENNTNRVVKLLMVSVPNHFRNGGNDR